MSTLPSRERVLSQIGFGMFSDNIPAPVLERARRFLHDDRPTPHMFKNPLLAEEPECR